jgi:hypothetical protein
MAIKEKFKMKKLIVLVLFFGIICGVAYASNTETYSVKSEVLTLSAIDSNWTDSAYKNVDSVVFYPGAASDIVYVRADSTSGPIVAPLQSTDGDPRIMYFFGKKIKLSILYSECTISAGGVVVINYTKSH